MSMKFLKIGYWVLLGVLLILFAHFTVFQIGFLDDGLAVIDSLASDQKASATNDLANNWNSIIMTASEVLVFLAIFVTIAFALYQVVISAITNKQGRKLLLITIAAGAAIVFVSYFLAEATVPFIIGLEDIPTPQTVKLIEAGLFITYVVAVITILALLYGEISKILK